ncbi:hypothetical protein RAD15_16255 [Bradyrhizobium sp. 14AA]
MARSPADASRVRGAWVLAPQGGQDELIQFCGAQCSDLLNRYWDEVAIETMQSLGQGNPDGRTFAIVPKYRSALLDELFAARDYVEPPFAAPPLIKCVFEHLRRVYQDQAFRESRIARLSALQMAEAERLRIDPAGGIRTKKDVIPFLEQFCGDLGYEGRSRNRWQKKVGGCLVFEVGVWLGGNAFRMRSPLKFRIVHVREPKYAFETEGAAVLGRLVPGADLYARWGSDLEYVLGIRALIELFNVIAGTFETALASGS